MEKFLGEIDQFSVEKENSEKLESLSKLSEFWVNEDMKQGLGSTLDSELEIKMDLAMNSHMLLHLRDDANTQ